MSIYQAIILEHYRNPRNFRTLKKATHRASLYNPLCGDKINLELVIKNDKVTEVGFTGEGCAISRASTSLLTEYTKGKTREKLINLDKTFMIDLIGIEVGPNRLKCLLLSLEALHKALKIDLKHG